ncbi:hypothetical protein BWU74_30560 [Paraburkholderia caledonica]|nr:hypothetical protein BWU74_30560 [Burkholderia sp. Bk]
MITLVLSSFLRCWRPATYRVVSLPNMFLMHTSRRYGVGGVVFSLHEKKFIDGDWKRLVVIETDWTARSIFPLIDRHRSACITF